jgi:hypothetical protein
MGLSWSTQNPGAVEANKSKVEEVKPTETTKTNIEEVAKTSEIVTEPVNETEVETNKERAVSDVLPPTPNSTPILTSATEDKSLEVLERYVEQQGTKVEVVPVDTSERMDVVKKTKRKKNKKNKD